MADHCESFGFPVCLVKVDGGFEFAKLVRDERLNRREALYLVRPPGDLLFESPEDTGYVDQRLIVRFEELFFSRNQEAALAGFRVLQCGKQVGSQVADN